ncbi:MAG: hypothetical protein EOO13_12280, partial [Chitinophagaceae bacterium]
MDRKRFDHIEQQMKTASDSWEPAFDEKAWEHMEQLLEERNDRKRPFIWWFWLIPLLLMIAGVGLFFSGNNDSEKGTATTTTNVPAHPTKIISQTGIPFTQQKEHAQPTAVKTQQQNIKHMIGFAQPPLQSASPIYTASPQDGSVKSNRINDSRRGKTRLLVSAGEMAEDSNKESPFTSIQQAVKASPDDSYVFAKPAVNDTVAKPALLSGTKDSSLQKQTPEAFSTKERSEKNRKASKFYFVIATGIDGNGVKFPGLNKFSTRSGALIGFHLTKKVSVQSGLFAGSKKYVAGKGDYKAQAGSYWSMVDITKVDANCRVYEIPLSLRYEFRSGKKWNSFASAGVSSYIMDKEDYAYDYIRYNNPYHAEASYKGNQHLFSVLRLSGGLERKLSPQFFIGITPGLAIPLA